MASPPIITKYTLSTRQSTASYHNRLPKDWILQGSNDNVNWTDLDTRTGVTGWRSYSLPEIRTYEFSNTTQYRYYRFWIDANNGNTYNTEIPELELIESGTTDACPDMTSNTAPSPCVVSAESVMSSGTPAFEAFDNDPEQQWISADYHIADTWVKFDFGVDAPAASYSITAQSDETTAPRSWKLLGSDDNENWTEIDSQDDITFSSNEKKEYGIDGTQYAYYRLYVTETNGAPYYQIHEFDMDFG
jgi:hypothetical protein